MAEAVTPGPGRDRSGVVPSPAPGPDGAAPGAGGAAAASPVRTGYRPALDGVRGVAILLVVVDHVAGTPLWHLGGYGVTLFFALSGYLITGLVADEVTRDGGLSYRRFYLRRTARLLPALLLVVLVCDALFWALGQTSAIKASLVTLAYLANYATVAYGDYLPGWGHTWSLAVEEHFYLVWPVVLVTLLRRRGPRAALRWTLVACLAALAWRGVLLALPYFDGVWFVVNHGTFARADALLYGCAAALALRLGWRPAAWMTWAAAGVVVALMVLRGPDVPVATAGQALLSVASAVLLAGLDHTRTALTRLLAWRPLVGLGVLSYGLYLWHYPLMTLAHLAGLEGAAWRALVGAVVAPAVAALSYRYVERPLRAAARAAEPRLLARAGAGGPRGGRHREA